MFQRLKLNPLEQCLLLIRIASVLVPTYSRETWREEWESEAWRAFEKLRNRGDPPALVRTQLRRFGIGSFRDAAWCRWNLSPRDELICSLRHWLGSAKVCLASLVVLVLLVAVTSGFLPATRAVLLPLPYRDAGRIATVSKGGISLAIRGGIPTEWAREWQRDSKVLSGVATYVWKRQSIESKFVGADQVMTAIVSENFFSVLGAGMASGRTFEPGDADSCADCVVVGYNFERAHGGTGSSLTLGGKRYRIIGVLEKRFWFLSRAILVWSVGSRDVRKPIRDPIAGVVVRLGPNVTKAEAEIELAALTQRAGNGPWSSLVDVSPLQTRVHSVFWSFGLGLSLAIVITGLRLRLPISGTQRNRFLRRGLFFGCKATLLLLIVLVSGLEFSRASSITMIGGTDLATEPISTWLFLVGSMGALSWSIHDQRLRCRVCLRRLGLATQVGCSGCLLLNWAGTEMVCVEGHGMLHIPEMNSSWNEPEQWTSLDDSWLELFVRKAE